MRFKRFVNGSLVSQSNIIDVVFRHYSYSRDLAGSYRGDPAPLAVREHDQRIRFLVVVIPHCKRVPASLSLTNKESCYGLPKDLTRKKTQILARAGGSRPGYPNSPTTLYSYDRSDPDIPGNPILYCSGPLQAATLLVVPAKGIASSVLAKPKFSGLL